MRYLPHTQQEIEEMLRAIGVKNIDQLFEPIPVEARLGRPLALEPALDEPSLMRHMTELAARNRGAAMLSFLGGGCYDHHIPPTVDQILLRSEFYTAYTPYQPEVAQGTLQAIFEYQTIGSELLGLPVCNASMYDVASAAAEAALMAKRLTKRHHIIVCDGVHPDTIRTIQTYISGTDSAGDSVVRTEVGDDGITSVESLGARLTDKTAAVIVGYPNFFGCVTDLPKLADKVHAAGALLVTVTPDPYALAILEPPGALGADIAVAEGQPLATAPQFGGPGVGIFTCRDDRKYLQEIPGRLVGETVDKDGKRGFVLTLATREQHIRRERATSNICSNQALVALSLTIRMCLLGKTGFVETARQCLAKADYLRKRIAALPGYAMIYPATPIFNEMLVKVRGGNAQAVCEKLARQDILAGVPVSRFYPERADQLLIAVTEKHRREDLDRLADALGAF
ncbi:MAG: aminomethyl-transferring glycine dehydrogenase subunit GcvPA [Deltaproteobacteria bacterium]|nr:aminomethyl-transferring glycine dehydrogenase subunit GcvPA [Deltaproteobacteria bacterium]